MIDPHTPLVEAAQISGDTEVLHVDVGGFEGPLDMLLELARRQKVDLAAISVSALAEQYLSFIETIGEQRIEIAADYLVMAAWLAYLKSQLMVPRAPSDDEPSGAEMAAALQFRLKRLEAMRRVATQLLHRPRLGVDTHPRGFPEQIVVRRCDSWKAGLFDLLKAYASQRERGLPNSYAPLRRNVVSLAQARERLQAMIGNVSSWMPLESLLARYAVAPQDAVSNHASSFSASLELVRQGRIELRQDGAFNPIYLRARRPSGEPR